VLVSRRTVTASAIDEAQATISELFCAHRLTPLDRRAVNMRLRSAHDDDVGIELLDYGEAVRIDVAKGLEDFYLVQLPLRGRATMDVGHATIQSSPDVATVPPLDREFTLRWGARTPTLIVYVARDRLRATARSLYGLHDADRLQLGLYLQTNTDAGAHFLRALHDHHDVLDRGDDAGRYVRRLTSELLVTRLLQAVENSASRALGVWQVPARTVGALRGETLVKRFQAAAEAGAVRGAGVHDIANELGTPVRTLQEHVRAATGSTPSALLRDFRLRQARQLLIAGDPLRDTVTTIAERCGFGHLGRFAAEYRARYGETPVRTLRG
jgi:AraC-like DNA-binding protein